ncbi:MAG: Maf family protein [Chitinophagaceae bacterium]|nr:Maf family protein [Chitinophagaceae bacterium]
MKKIVLASQSPRRKQLLEWAEIEFDILAKETDEHFPPGMSVEEIPVYIARNKANATRNSETFKRYENNTTVLAADTIVVLNNKVIGKPQTREEAISILSALSGNKHFVITGIVITDGKKETSFSDSTEVEFYPLSRNEIEFYVDKYQPYDKAGAYAIQEWIGVVGIKSINGDFYNVMGLPVSRVVKALEKF